MTLRKKQKEQDEVKISMDIPNKKTDTVCEDVAEETPRGTRVTRTKGFLRGIFTNKVRIISFVLVIIIVSTSSAFYFHWFNLGLSKQEIQQRQIEAVVSSIGKLMIVPKGTPVLATVKDIAKLKQQQAFFRNAENGDDLVIFPQSNMAVIYSPSRNLIINVGPIRYPKTSTAVKTSAQTSDRTGLQNKHPVVAVAKKGQITIDVRNGSGKTGIAGSIAQTLKGNALYFIEKVGDAGNQNYKKNLVIDLAKKSGETSSIDSLAKSLNATIISGLPYGEKPSSADVVVILGS